MSVTPLDWYFDPGEVLVSVAALNYLGGWSMVDRLVHTKHVLQKHKRSLWLIRGWKVLVSTKKSYTSVVMWEERTRWVNKAGRVIV